MKRQQSNGSWITFDGADGEKLYFCDPAKNTRCSKEGCHVQCFHTMNEEFGLFTPEPIKISDVYSKREFDEKVEKILARKDSPCRKCDYYGKCVSGTSCGKFQHWFQDMLSTEIYKNK